MEGGEVVKCEWFKFERKRKTHQEVGITFIRTTRYRIGVKVFCWRGYLLLAWESGVK